MDGQEVCFYDVGTLVEKVKRGPDGLEAVMSAYYEELKKEMTSVREELGGVRMKIQAIEGSGSRRNSPRPSRWLPPGPGSAAR